MHSAVGKHLSIQPAVSGQPQEVPWAASTGLILHLLHESSVSRSSLITQVEAQLYIDAQKASADWSRHLLGPAILCSGPHLAACVPFIQVGSQNPVAAVKGVLECMQTVSHGHTKDLQVSKRTNGRQLSAQNMAAEI